MCFTFASKTNACASQFYQRRSWCSCVSCLNVKAGCMTLLYDSYQISFYYFNIKKKTLGFSQLQNTEHNSNRLPAPAFQMY